MFTKYQVQTIESVINYHIYVLHFPAFVAIPTVPATISGQWLTFSHMANHYRKLLNVKSRVETCPPNKSKTQLISAPTVIFL